MARRQAKKAKKLYRSSTDRQVAGVFGGLGAYLHINSNLLRVVYAIVSVLTGLFPGVVLYLMMVVIIPPEPDAPSWFNLFAHANDTLNHLNHQRESNSPKGPRQLHDVEIHDVHDDSLKSPKH